MPLAAALIYWVIVAAWLTVLGAILAFYIRNPRVFGTTRLLLAVVAIDILRNIIENTYFGFYFGSQYGLFSSSIGSVLGNPVLLIMPKLANVAAACVVLCLLLLRWLPAAITEHEKSEQRAVDLSAFAAIDGLTGLYDRRHFEANAHAEWARFCRYHRPLSILIVDIDHFKAVNDRFGHGAGDDVLRIIATTCHSAKRDSDMAARFGGEEFALLLPETDDSAARVVAERMRKLVRQCAPTIGEERLYLTVSIGIATATLGMSSMEALIKCADDALYEAKRSGRDRVVSASANATKRFVSAAG